MVNTDKRVKIQMIIVVSCVIFAILMLAALIMSLVSLASASTRKKSLEAQLLYLDNQLTQNERDIAYYEDEEYIDRIAREYLNMQGKDDITFIGK